MDVAALIDEAERELDAGHDKQAARLLTDAFEDWYAYLRASLPSSAAKRRAAGATPRRRANP